MLDGDLGFTPTSTPQVLTATGNLTNQIDQLAARNIGGAPEHVYWTTVLKALSGTSPTLRLQLVGADDAALTSNVVTILDTGVLSPPAVGYLTRIPVPTHTPKRYIGVIATAGGTTPSFTLDSSLSGNVPTNEEIP